MNETQKVITISSTEHLHIKCKAIMNFENNVLVHQAQYSKVHHVDKAIIEFDIHRMDAEVLHELLSHLLGVCNENECCHCDESKDW